jgi:hypothetical protein
MISLPQEQRADYGRIGVGAATPSAIGAVTVEPDIGGTSVNPKGQATAGD